MGCPGVTGEVAGRPRYVGYPGLQPLRPVTTLGPEVMPAPHLPVFFDPRQRRWPRIKRLVLILAVPVVLVLSVLAFAIMDRTRLPGLPLPRPARQPPALEGVSALPPPPPATGPSPRMQQMEEHQRRLSALQEGRRRASRKAPATVPAAPGDGDLRCAFLVDQEAGLTALRTHGQDLDLLFPRMLHCTGPEAVLQAPAAESEARILRALKTARPRLGWMPVVDNCDGAAWDGMALAAALMHAGNRSRLCTALVAAAKRLEASGLCIDFQDFAGDLPPSATRTRAGRAVTPPAARSRYEAYLLFLGDLRKALQREHLRLAVCVPGDRPDFPYRSTATLADRVVVTAFDRFAAPGAPVPLASRSWFETALARRLEDVGRERLLLALGNHAHDWTLGSITVPTVLSSDEAVCLARDRQAIWSLDPSSANPHFIYRDDGQRQHRVLALDAVTAFNQMATAQGRTAGFALWHLGAEDPTLWRIFPRGCVFDRTAAEGLRDQGLDPPFTFVGAGEVLRVTAPLTPGVRDLVFDDADGRITAAGWRDYPTPCTVTRWGRVEKRIVLTFDDGPDPAYTPTILDILRKAGLHATFFIVGSQGERHPWLLDRIVAEGHEIGNHTFTHPNVLRLSLGQLELELNTTQRLIAARTGRQTLLYRAPMGLDAEPKTLEEVRCLEAVNALGYLCVGMHLDPNDWEQKDAGAIVDEVMAAAKRGPGNVVLLHDGGGDRSATVAALPHLITGLQEDGFEFTTIAGLLDTSRDALMPPVQASFGGMLERLGFSLVHLVLYTLEWLFLLGVVLGSARMALIAVLALLEHRRARRQRFRAGYLPRVAVLVPAYNEEKVVVQTVQSLLASDYRGSLEIVVVDDGSKDQTHRITQEAFDGRSRIRALTKENGGKALALNYGIAQTQAEVLVAMDADTVFKPDTIRLLVRHFGDPRVGAVAGNAKVGNRVNLMTRWQALEYITCQNLDRRAFALVNAITVVPGAVGAWRREAVVQAGGFTHATLAEDADLTMAILRLGYAVRNEAEAVALTEAPDTARGFMKQRHRWMFGTLQAAFRHRGALLELHPLGFIAMPNVLIFGVLFPLISPVMDLMLVLALGSWAWDHWYRGVDATISWHVLGWYLAFVGIDHAAAWLAFGLEPGEDRRLMRWLFLQRFLYRQLMYVVAIRSFLAVLRGQAVGWGKLERKATVAQPLT